MYGGKNRRFFVQVWQKKGVTDANIVYSRQSGILIKATEEEEKDGEKTWSLPKTAAPSPTPAIKVKLSWWTPGLRGALLTPITPLPTSLPPTPPYPP